MMKRKMRSIMNRYVATSLMYGQGKTNKRWPRCAKDAVAPHARSKYIINYIYFERSIN